jgi:hypothetical protein
MITAILISETFLGHIQQMEHWHMSPSPALHMIPLHMAARRNYMSTRWFQPRILYSVIHIIAGLSSAHTHKILDVAMYGGVGHKHRILEHGMSQIAGQARLPLALPNSIIFIS